MRWLREKIATILVLAVVLGGVPATLLNVSCTNEKGTDPPPKSECVYDTFPGSSGVMDYRVRWHPFESSVFLYTHRLPGDEPHEELGSYKIYKVNTTSGEIGLLVFGADGDWSPDGDRIVFSRQPGPRLWIMDIPSGEQQDLGPGSEPNWHPVRDQILYNASVAEGGGLHVLDVESDTRTRLRRGTSGEWSPDGHTVLAYDGGLGLITFPVEAPDSARMLVEAGTPWYFHWHPSGRQVTYRDRVNQLMIDIETLQVDTLITGSWEVSFSPSSDRFIFSAAEVGRRVGVLFLMSADTMDCRQLTSRDDYPFVKELVR